jgi:ADP-dependent NAD(P)H-hydrate dehydratase / NAD(P)H-hydrate epimerase
MRGVWSVDDVRCAEQEVMARLPDGALMQRAAYALSVHCARVLGRVYGGLVVVLVGSGSNGGDALFAAALLARRGAQVFAVLLDPPRAHRDGLQALHDAGGRVVSTSDGQWLVTEADLVVDGIVGVGGKAGLRGEAVPLAEAARGRPTVAVDLPSGVDADTGFAGDAAIQATVTVTFGALKTGLVCGRGAQLAGTVHVVDIGLDEALPAPRIQILEQADVAALLPKPHAGDDKYTRGVVGVVAGSAQYPGAGVLATGSAIHGGAGMVRYLGGAVDEIRARYPEVIVHAGARPDDVQVQAWVIGPGIGTDGAAGSMVAEVLGTELPVIVDADAITLMARTPQLVRKRSAPTVLTPHDREFARFAGEPGQDRIGATRRAAADLGATVLLKGNVTVVAGPDGSVYLNPTGTPWLATAGSGDVLSGLIGSLLAAGIPATDAAAAGAYLHGVAARLAAEAGPPSSGDVLTALRPALASVAAE